MSQIDGTLRQLLAEIYQCHREIEVLRQQNAALEQRLSEQEQRETVARSRRTKEPAQD